MNLQDASKIAFSANKVFSTIPDLLSMGGGNNCSSYASTKFLNDASFQERFEEIRTLEKLALQGSFLGSASSKLLEEALEDEEEKIELSSKIKGVIFDTSLALLKELSLADKENLVAFLASQVEHDKNDLLREEEELQKRLREKRKK